MANEITTFNEVEQYYADFGIEKTLKEFGHFIATQGVLNYYFKKRWYEKRNNKISIFISYSWYSGELLKWVDNFISIIKKYDFEIYYDKDILPKEFEPLNLPIVAEFVSNIFICDYFIRIIDKTYIDNVQARNNKTSFVFDENHRAMFLRYHCNHPIKLVNILLEDEPNRQEIANDIYVDLRPNIQNLNPLMRFLEYIKNNKNG